MCSQAAGDPDDILRWIQAGAPEPQRFGALAMDLFAYQYQRNLPYRNYADALGRSPQQVSSWEQIPALPCDAFKIPTMPICCFDAGQVSRTFLTSGTTSGTRGSHWFADTSTYEASVRTGWRLLGLPALRNPWFLTQSPAQAPESSLVHMLATLGEEFEDLPQRWLLDDGQIRYAALERAVAAGQPVELLGTALGFLELIDSFAPLPLPAGSWLMETGGYKASGRSLDKSELYARLSCHFQLDPAKLHNEYGMTEISSPFYTQGIGQTHRGAPWTAIRVVDPETGLRCPLGVAGYLEIVDLANVGSVLAVATQDFALAHGLREFTLLGRDPGALPRGCSLGAAEFLNLPQP